MRTKAKFIITATVVSAFVIIKETLNLERRSEELDKYEEGVKDVVNSINDGLEIENVVNINFKK